jgi:hypothetical protein
MAKLAYSKLGIKTSQEIKTITFNDQLIEVKQYLPIEDKLKIVENVLNYSAEDKRFYNVGKIEVFLTLEVFYNYTNITFTDKQKENLPKLYDNLNTSGLMSSVIETIPEQEFLFLYNLVKKTVKSVYNYSNSIMGILDTVSQDYSNLDLDATAIQQKLMDPNNMELLKSVLSKLG